MDVGPGGSATEEGGAVPAYHNELGGLLEDPLPELEGGRGREQVGDLGVEVARLGVGRAVEGKGGSIIRTVKKTMVC